MMVIIKKYILIWTNWSFVSFLLTTSLFPIVRIW